MLESNVDRVAAKTTVPCAPTARVPTGNVQTEPAELPGAQLHPAVDDTGSKTVPGGTVSVTVTFAASWFPVLKYLIV